MKVTLSDGAKINFSEDQTYAVLKTLIAIRNAGGEYEALHEDIEILHDALYESGWYERNE